MAKSTSLAEAAGLTQPKVNIPDVFQPTEHSAMKGRALAPYITFANSQKQDEWAKIMNVTKQAPQNDEMYLIDGDRVVHLSTVKCTMIHFKQFWVETDKAGNVTKVSYKEMPWPWQERCEAVLMVYETDRVLPVNIQFRTTKCPGAKVMSDALLEAGTEKWAEKGQAYKDSLVAPKPFMRFYADVKLGPQRTSKTSGKPYRCTVASIAPTSTPEWRLLTEFFKDEKSQKALDDAAARFVNYMAENDKLAAK